jgi:VIT1/CCC1 family predicted Fe2+/Mn2+ transporter
MARHRHHETHTVLRLGWLRASVLGANDGLLSTASLIAGVVSASPNHAAVIIAALSAVLAGALSMAAGEFVSVSSQSDAEQADLRREAEELREDPKSERAELAAIYVSRGLDAALADEVAGQLMAKDALKAHARDELGLTDVTRAKPLQAALASAGSFVAGGLAPLAVAVLTPAPHLIYVLAPVVLLALGALGVVGAKAGGAAAGPAVARVVFWGAAALGVSTGVGRLVGVVV